MRTHRIYLAGPMQGYPEFNFPAFNEAASKLRFFGHVVFSPAEKDIERHDGVDISKGNANGDVTVAVTEHKFSLRDALRDDMVWICQSATAIAMLPGWENSKGAQAEWALARALGHEIIYLTYSQDKKLVIPPSIDHVDGPIAEVLRNAA